MIHTQIKRAQIIKTDIDTLWNFMSAPVNLKSITPKYMLFDIISKNNDEKIYPGMIIAYKVAPLLKIPMTWITEITKIEEKKLFIDEQKVGPYKLWHHQHIFTIKQDGILMEDIITYTPPFGLIGRIANFLFIKNTINKIFDYRNQVLAKQFNNVLDTN